MRRAPAKGCPPGFTRDSGLEAIDGALPRAGVVMPAAARTDETRQVLDVFAREPLAPMSALWQLREVVRTPRAGGVSPRRFWDRPVSLFVENWRSYAEGRPLRNLVDKTLGY